MLSFLEKVVSLFGCGPCFTLAAPSEHRQPLDSPPVAHLQPLIPPQLPGTTRCSIDSDAQAPATARQPSGNENVGRQPSWNTNVVRMREGSPFFQIQTRSRRSGEGLELKSANGPNLLLGQYHMEGRGKFVPKHPGLVVRRPASPMVGSPCDAITAGPGGGPV